MNGAAQVAKGQRFNMLLYVAKAEMRDGDWWLDAVATGSAVDWYGDSMSPACVQSMVRQFNEGKLPLRTSHYTDWESDMGWIRKGSIDPSGEATISVLLDSEHPDTKKLIRSLTGMPEKGIAPRKLGVSIGGFCTQDDVSWQTIDGKNVRVLNDIVLDHVAVTSSPAYPNAWVEGLETKSSETRYPWAKGIRKALDALQVEPSQRQNTDAEDAVQRSTDDNIDADATDDAGSEEVKAADSGDSTHDCLCQQGEWVGQDAIGPSDRILVYRGEAPTNDDEGDDSTMDEEQDKSGTGTDNGAASDVQKSTNMTAADIANIAAQTTVAVLKQLGIVGVNDKKTSDEDGSDPGTDGGNASHNIDRSGTPRNVATDNGEHRGAQSTIAALKESEAYRNASSGERVRMLNNALRSGLAEVAKQ